MDNDLLKAVESLVNAINTLTSCLNCGGTGIQRQETWLNGKKAFTESQCACRSIAEGHAAQAQSHVNSFRILQDSFTVD